MFFFKDKFIKKNLLPCLISLEMWKHFNKFCFHELKRWLVVIPCLEEYLLSVIPGFSVCF